MKINDHSISDTQKLFQLSQLKTNVLSNVGVLFVFLGVYFFFLSPQLTNVAATEASLHAEYQKYINLKTKGFTLSELVGVIPDEKKDEKALIKNSGEDLYKEIFSNTTSKDYLEFLNTKQLELIEKKQGDFLQERDLKIAKALPFFGDGVDVGKGVATELTMVSYLERLFKTFNISVQGTFDIKNLKMVNPEELKNQNNSYSSQMFYNQLNLKLEGRKSDLVEFFYFIQNVGNISVVKNGDVEDIVFYSDNVIRKKLFSTTNQPTTNIYENVLMDLESIKLQNYIDESDSIRMSSQESEVGFIDFVKSTVNANQVISADVKINLYMRGVPLYKKESDIRDFFTNFEGLKGEIQKALQQSKNRNLQKTNVKMIDVANTLTSLKVYVDSLDTKVKTMKTGMNQKENIENIYQETYDIKKDLETIQRTLINAKNIISETQNIKK